MNHIRHVLKKAYNRHVPEQLKPGIGLLGRRIFSSIEDIIHKEKPHEVLIETYSLCNGACENCPPKECTDVL